MILWFYKFLILKLQILRRTHVRLGSFRHKLESNFALSHPSLNTPVEHHRIQSCQRVRTGFRPTHTVVFLASSSHPVLLRSTGLLENTASTVDGVARSTAWRCGCAPDTLSGVQSAGDLPIFLARVAEVGLVCIEEGFLGRAAVVSAECRFRHYRTMSLTMPAKMPVRATTAPISGRPSI